jgi:hypothetical protein
VPLLLALAAASALSLAGVVGSRHLDGVDARLVRLESGLAQGPRARRELAQELAVVRAELDSVRTELDEARATEIEAHLLAGRLAGAETRLVDIAGVIEAHDTSLDMLTEASSAIAPTLEQHLREQARAMVALWEQLRERVDDARSLAVESAARIERVESLEDRDVVRMWNELVGPTVQLAGDESVGSGVVLRSRRRAGTDPAVYDTFVMTAWHVVRDIIVGDLERPVPVTIYSLDGSIDSQTATLLTHDAARDVALLRLDSDAPVACGAELASPARIAAYGIFDQIYAVGCPLGNDPIPTPGEISTLRHVVDGVNYWMINAPTYIGNSGGGIFDAQTHELLGIFSKIYTHGTVRPTIVPHMGLVTPLDDVYGWLAAEGYGDLVPADSAIADAR